MRKADAPPAGWYPDPTGGSRLWWWDGLDWTDARAAPPSRGIAVPERPGGEAAFADPAAAAREAARGAAATVTSAVSSAGLGRHDTQDFLAEVRKVARSEVDRATDAVRQQALQAQRRFEPLVSQYGTQVVRWIRIAVIVAIVLLVGWFVLQVVTQASLMEWLGERVDNLVGGGEAIGPRPTQFTATVT